MSHRRSVIAFAATLTLVIISTFTASMFMSQGELVLKNADTGEVYKRFPIGLQGGFSVTFIHSVNKSPYTDYYVVSEEGIFNTGARYYAFGAGAPSQLTPGQKIEYLDDGSMMVTGTSVKLDRLIYIVGTISDSILGINGEKYGLTELCGKNSVVEFVFE